MPRNETETCVCSRQGCWRGPDNDIPAYCQANHFQKEIETARKAYCDPDVASMYKAACIVGLCMGHDILFNQRSKAPVSTLIVKDRLMGNNPAAALYAYHARRSLFKLGRSSEELV